MDSIMISGTPWEQYEIYDGVDVWPVWVKRDDLCCELPGPPYSKLRGLELFLTKQDKDNLIGVQAAGAHSRSGWGTAYLCKHLGMKCHVFYPVYKREGTVEDHELREYLANAEDLGAVLMPMKAGRASMIWYQARNIMKAKSDKAIMLPAGLKLQESVIGTAAEVVAHTPEHLRAGTWILSISSGTTGAGTIMGLKDYQTDIHFTAYMGNSKNKDKTYKYMCDMAGYEPYDLELIDEGWKYSDAEDRPVPFPASKYYEAKAWHWMVENIEHLMQPVIFWNIGS